LPFGRLSPALTDIVDNPQRKKPTWLNTGRCSTTSVYSSTSLPAKPDCPSSSRPTTVGGAERTRTSPSLQFYVGSPAKQMSRAPLVPQQGRRPLSSPDKRRLGFVDGDDFEFEQVGGEVPNDDRLPTLQSMTERPSHSGRLRFSRAPDSGARILLCFAKVGGSR